jgi:Golgi nucleoside diphosphatase
MSTMKKESMREEAKRDIIEALQDGYAGYYCDLHNEIFNTSYYIIGTYEAKKAIEEYGVFEAIKRIQEYEKDNFGEITTDLSDPEKLINMLYYIIGMEVLSEIMEDINVFHDNWNSKATDETNKEILEAIGEDV